MDGLTPGRMVHYVAYGTPGGEYPAGVHRAAVVTQVVKNEADGQLPVVGLCVINPTGLFFHEAVTYNGAGLPGTWHWIERA